MMRSYVRSTPIGLTIVVGLIAAAMAEGKSLPSPNLPCALPGKNAATYLSLDPLPAPVK